MSMLIFFQETQAPSFNSRPRLYLLGKITGLVEDQYAPVWLYYRVLLQMWGTPITALSILLRCAAVDGQFIVMVSKLMNSTYN